MRSGERRVVSSVNLCGAVSVWASSEPQRGPLEPRGAHGLTLVSGDQQPGRAPPSKGDGAAQLGHHRQFHQSQVLRLVHHDSVEVVEPAGEKVLSQSSDRLGRRHQFRERSLQLGGRVPLQTFGDGQQALRRTVSDSLSPAPNPAVPRIGETGQAPLA